MKLMQNAPGGQYPTLPQRLREVRPTPRTRGGKPARGPCQAPPASRPLTGALPRSLIPPDGLSVREPSLPRADGAADTCKNKTQSIH